MRPDRTFARGSRLRLALALLVTVLPARAQGPENGQRVREELARTDEILEQARATVGESGSVRARELLDQADSIQRGARGHLEGGRWLQATRMTLEARGLAARAVTMAREETGAGQRAMREIERGERAIALAKDALPQPPPEPPLRMLGEASALLDRARATFGEQQYTASLRLAVAAQRLAAQAAAFGARGGGRRLERDIDRTDHLLDRVGELMARADAALHEDYDRARRLQDQARRALQESRSGEAAARTREARALANRIRVALGGADDAAAVESALRVTQDLLERTAQRIYLSDNRRAAVLLERASEHHARALEAYRAGQLRPALAQTRVARNLAKRALEMIEASDGP